MPLEAPVQNVEVVELQHDGDARQQRQGPPRQRREQQAIAAVLVVSRAAAQLGVLVDRDVHPHAGLHPADTVVLAQLEDAVVVELEKVGREAAVERVRGGRVRDVERARLAVGVVADGERQEFGAGARAPEWAPPVECDPRHVARRADRRRVGRVVAHPQDDLARDHQGPFRPPCTEVRRHVGFKEQRLDVAAATQHRDVAGLELLLHQAVAHRRRREVDIVPFGERREALCGDGAGAQAEDQRHNRTREWGEGRSTFR